MKALLQIGESVVSLAEDFIEESVSPVLEEILHFTSGAGGLLPPPSRRVRRPLIPSRVPDGLRITVPVSCSMLPEIERSAKDLSAGAADPAYIAVVKLPSLRIGGLFKVADPESVVPNPGVVIAALNFTEG